MKLRDFLETCVTEVDVITIIPIDHDDNEGLGETFIQEGPWKLRTVVRAQTTSAYLDWEVETWRIYRNCLSITVIEEE